MNKVTLPWPPTVNTYYRSVGGQMKISEKGRAYAKAVADQVMVQRIKRGMAGKLNVHIVAFPPDKRKRDLDNLFKAVLDSLTKAGVWIDDSQIDYLSIRRDDSIGGYLHVTIDDFHASFAAPDDSTR